MGLKGLKDKISPEKIASMVNAPNRMSLNAIGMEYNVSRQRVHQILKDYKRDYPDLFMDEEPPSKKEIEKLMEQSHSMSFIAKELSITVGRLKKLMAEYNLEKKFIKNLLSPELLSSLYVEKEMSDDEIAAKFNCSRNTVMKLRFNNQIYNRQRKPLSERLTKELFIELYKCRGLKLKQLAVLFNTNLQNIVALKKKYGIDQIVANGSAKKNVRYRAEGVDAKELQSIKANLIKKGVIYDHEKDKATYSTDDRALRNDHHAYRM